MLHSNKPGAVQMPVHARFNKQIILIRGGLEPSEYKHVALGLIFLRKL